MEVKNCQACKDKKKRPHGPYWNLNYTDERGRMQTAYVGKKLPDFVSGSHKVAICRYSTILETE